MVADGQTVLLCRIALTAAVSYLKCFRHIKIEQGLVVYGIFCLSPDARSYGVGLRCADLRRSWAVRLQSCPMVGTMKPHPVQATKPM